MNFTSFSSDFRQENNELELWQSLLHQCYFGHIRMPSNIEMQNWLHIDLAPILKPTIIHQVLMHYPWLDSTSTTD